MKARVSQLCAILGIVIYILTPLHAQTVDAYITGDFNAGTVQVFSEGTNQLFESIQVGSSPGRALISPDGHLAYVPNLNSGYMSVIDLTIGAETKRLQGVRGTNAAITADGKQLVSSSVTPGSIAVINTSDFSVVTVPLGSICDDATPANCISGDDFLIGGVGISIAGHKAYINARASIPIRVATVDLNTMAVSTIPGTAVGLGNTGSISTTVDGSLVIAKRTNPRALMVIDTATDTLTQKLIPAVAPIAVIATFNPSFPGGSFAYVPGIDNLGNPVVQAYSVAGGSLSLAGTARLASSPTAVNIGLNLDNTRLYLGGGNTLQVVDTLAIVNNPAGALVTTRQIGNSLSGLAGGGIALQLSAAAPSVTAVSPNLLINNDTVAGRTITVTGTNFSPDAFLRVGNLDPLATTSSASSLQLVVPSETAAQTADLIVTNPNPGSPASSQHLSGILRGELTITSPPTYQPANQVVVGNFGNSTAAVLNVSTNAGVLPTTPGVLGALGVGITPDGERAYIGQFNRASVSALNLAQNHLEATVLLDRNSALAQQDGVVVVPSSFFGGPVVYTTAAVPLPDGNFDQRLFVIDANAAHSATTLNTLLTTFSAGQEFAGLLTSGANAATPDGLHVYTNIHSRVGDDGWIVVFDVVNNIARVIPTATLNASGAQQHIEVSPDGKSLVLTGPEQKSILVFDICNDPLNPSLLASITPVVPPGFTPFIAASFRIPANAPNRLIALDGTQSLLVVLNFDRPGANFSQLGEVVIPGTPDLQGDGGLDVTSDGTLIYAGLFAEDAVAVLDANKVASSDPSALLTKIFTGLGPASLAIRPGTPTPVSTAANPLVNISPIQNVNISFSNVTVPGATTVTTTNTTPFSAPAGFQINNVPVFFEINTTASFGTAVVCIHYDPAQVPSPENALRLAHFNRSIDPITGQVIGWEDVTIPGSPDTSTHTICGQVSSFSPFVIGIASVNFLFNSLLADIDALPKAATPVGEIRELRAKILAARTLADKGRNLSAIKKLNDFVEEVQDLSGTRLAVGDAQTLIAEAMQIIAELQ